MSEFDNRNVMVLFSECKIFLVYHSVRPGKGRQNYGWILAMLSFRGEGGAPGRGVAAARRVHRAPPARGGRHRFLARVRGGGRKLDPLGIEILVHNRSSSGST